jgi:hypothetical protein
MSKDGKSFITDDLEIIDFFRVLMKSKEKLWIWQQLENDKGERPIHFCTLRKFDVLKKSLELTPLTEEGFGFNTESRELFLYSRKRNIAFKFSPREFESHYIMLGMPDRLNYLSEELAAKLSFVEEENEDSQIHLRQQPRKVAGEKQTVKLIRQDQNKPQQFNLYDISAGGMALRCPDPGVFKKGDLITIVSINQNQLPQEIKGQIVSIRHMIEDDQFKVGVQFV